MWTGYGYFNRTEIWNNERTLAYLQGDPLNGIPGLKSRATSLVEDCGCKTGRPLFCDQGVGEDGAYTSPELDDAPWYDENVPESAEFAGLFVEDITGFDSVVRRNVVDGAIGGGTLGPLRLSTRSITVTGWLRAKTCCAAEYGLRWLQAALIGDVACENCSLSDLYMLKCCPEDDVADCHVQFVSGRPITVKEDLVDPSNNVQISVSDLGGGVFDLRVLCPLQDDVLSDPRGAVNNSDGYLLQCLDGVDPLALALLSVEPTSAIPVLQSDFWIAYDSITGTVDIPVGDGRDVTWTIDTNNALTCDDADTLQVETAAAFLQWIVDHGDAVLTAVVPSTTGECYTIGEGPDPLTFARFFHRTGLVDGPKVLERRGSCCDAECGCTNIRVQFTLASELPYIFSDIEWCLIDQQFPIKTSFCIDLEYCRDCTDPIGTQIIEREVPRPECSVLIRHDGTWCAEGWNPDDGFPPEDCLMVPNPEAFDPATDEGAGTQGSPCLIDLNNGGTWDPVNFNPAVEFEPQFCALEIRNPQGPCDEQDRRVCEGGGGTGDECDVTLVDNGTWTANGWTVSDENFPPECCEINITNGGDCPDDDDRHCQVRLIYNPCADTMTWEAVNWNGDLNNNDCDCYEICELCIEGQETCLVRVFYNHADDSRTWEPIRWSGDINDQCCSCFIIAEVVELNEPENACPPTTLVDCPVFLYADGTYDRIGWAWNVTDGIFPPPDCNITIANDQDTGPIIEELEIPANIFVPDCGPLPVVPPPPFAGFESCYCEPWATFRACCTFDNPFQWNDATSYIEVNAGSKDIRNMKIEAFRNPWADQGVSCPCDPEDPFWKCKSPCTTVLIPHLPSGSKLIIDSRTRVAEITFAGGEKTNGLRFVESEGGAPFDWFDISQCAQLCIVVSADCTTIADNASVSIGMIGRYLASGW